jgi:CubicO group peptidase (beta-lactamase class C family)
MHTRLLAVVAVCSLSVAVTTVLVAQAPLKQLDGELDHFIDQRMKDAAIAGLGAAIIVDKKVVWNKGYGFADRARAVPFTPDTVMNIGSISKTFTGAALMLAAQERKLSLDEDINTYLPFKVVNPYHPNEKITLRQLGTHTSGITDRWAVYEATYRYDAAPESLRDFLESYFTPGQARYSKDNFLNAKPGTHREYSNMGAALAGYVVERAVGEKLNSYTRRHFFVPLRMNNTGWFLSEVAGKHARLYVAQDGVTIPIPLYELTDLSGRRRSHLCIRSVQVLYRFVEQRRIPGDTHHGEAVSRGDASVPVHRIQQAGQCEPSEREFGELWDLLGNAIQRHPNRT